MINAFRIDSVYDRFVAKISRKYGNGLKMQYAYHPQNRRLTAITTFSGNSQLSHTAYTYDLVGNVTQAVSSYPWLAGQTFTETFSYDSTNQLVSAANPQTYALSVTYGDWGKIQEYGLQQTDLASNTTTGQTRTYNYGSLNEGQTTFAPNNISYADGTNVNEQYGIGGSLLKRETNRPGNQPETEHYRFTANGNLQAYMYENLLYVHYGYNDANTRTYKYSFDLTPNWVNGRLENVSFNPHTAMFYPNSYLNFNQDGHYTKHYYNGMERIASRLGDRNISINVNDPELQDRKDWQDSLIRKNVTEITGYEFLPVGEEQNHEDPKPVFELPQVGITGLQPIGSGDVYYYHPNHLGSTCYVTDGNASVQQGFLYAPFGEITNEYNNSFGSSIIPKYSFNAKELDEETGMYYYEARYMAPPVFISRDPLFEKYPTFSPYAYCANNPVKYVDPDGRKIWITGDDGNLYQYKKGKIFDSNGKEYFGSDEFVNEVYSALKWLSKNGIRRELRKMSRNKYEITISKTDKGTEHCSLHDENESNGIGCGSYILFNPTITKLKKDGKTLPVYGLAHELGHAYDAMRGIIDYTGCPVYEKGSNYTNMYIYMYEVNAVRFENYVRPIKSQRTSYNGFDLSPLGVTKEAQNNVEDNNSDDILRSIEKKCKKNDR